MNIVILMGNLGQDPETKVFESNNSVTRFSLATNKTWKDKNGEKQKKTEWHNCLAWGKSGEVISKYFKKGDQILINGEVNYRKYEKEGRTIYTTDIVVQSFEFVGGSGERSSNDNRFPSSDPFGSGGEPAFTTQASTDFDNAVNGGREPLKLDDIEDDLPF